MANRKDIALKANVSTATVTNVLNNSKYVSPETRRRVMDAARELQYPIEKMRQTVMSKTQEIALVVNDTSNPHYSQIMDGMNEIAVQHNYAVSMMKLWSKADDFCDMLIDRHINGAFFSINHGELEQRHIDKLNAAGVHVANAKCIIDYNGMMDKVIQYLADLGHRRIAYLSGLSIQDPYNTRYTAYLEAVRKAGLPQDASLTIDGVFPYDTTIRSGYWAMRSKLDAPLDFTAVIALNDLLALGAIKAITEKGLRIPEDISVIGCDDIMFSEFCNPPLTTLRIPAKVFGRQAMYDIIQSQLGEVPPPVHLAVELIIRKSSGRAGSLPNTPGGTRPYSIMAPNPPTQGR